MLYEAISKMCKEKKMSIARLERESGLGNATIRRWKFSSPRIESLQAVAKTLGCTIEELISVSDCGNGTL